MRVVNCFHFSVSLGYKTTVPQNTIASFMLWIAFIFQYLWDTKQRLMRKVFSATCCELLSFFSIFGIQNNMVGLMRLSVLVVNCFHFSVSLGYKTTFIHIDCFVYWLWIAFIFQYLWDTKQHFDNFSEAIRSCELLSFFSIFGIQNNFAHPFIGQSRVVNCFHFSVSLGYKTTKKEIYISIILLWIAFIFQYLWDTKQRLFF